MRDTVQLIYDLLNAMYDPYTEEKQQSYDVRYRAAMDVLSRLDKEPEPPAGMRREHNGADNS